MRSERGRPTRESGASARRPLRRATSASSWRSLTISASSSSRWRRNAASTWSPMWRKSSSQAVTSDGTSRLLRGRGIESTIVPGRVGRKRVGRATLARGRMDLHQLETFLAVVEHKSFSRAARAMHTTQSTVSFHVRALERALGTRLIDRGGRIVRATAAGRLLARYATRMVGMRDDALAQLSAQEQGDRGRVRIAASTIPAEYLLPPILARFHQRYPQGAVAVDGLESAGALDALLAESCDLALSGARRADRRIEYTAFAEDEVVLVTAARGRLMPPSGRAAAAWLREAPLIRREEG